MFAIRLARHQSALQHSFKYASLSTLSSIYPRRNGTADVVWTAAGSTRAADGEVRFVASLPPGADDLQIADFGSSSNGSVQSLNIDGRRSFFVKHASGSTVVDVRKGTVAAIAAARNSKPIKSLEINMKDLSKEDSDVAVQAALLSNYVFDPYLGTKAKEGKARLLQQLVCGHSYMNLLLFVYIDLHTWTQY